MKKIEQVQTDVGSRPLQRVEITDSGVIDVPVPFEETKDAVL